MQITVTKHKGSIVDTGIEELTQLTQQEWYEKWREQNADEKTFDYFNFSFLFIEESQNA